MTRHALYLSLLALLIGCGPRPPVDRPTPPDVVEAHRRAEFDAGVILFDEGAFEVAKKTFHGLARGPRDALTPYVEFYLARIAARRSGEGGRALLRLADTSSPDDVTRAASLLGGIAASRAGRCDAARRHLEPLAPTLDDTPRADTEQALARCALGLRALAHLEEAAHYAPGRVTLVRKQAAHTIEALTVDGLVTGLDRFGDGPLGAPIRAQMLKVAIQTGDAALAAQARGVEYKDAARPVTIGLVLPRTGRSRRLGRRLEAGVAWRGDEDRPAGRALKLEIRDGGTPPQARAAIESLKDAGVYGIVGLFDRSTAKAAAEISRGEIPLVMLTLSDAPIRTTNAWRALPTPQLAARTAAGAGLKRGGKKALIVRPKTRYGETRARAFRQAWVRGGGQVVGELTWSRGKANWSKLTRRVHRKRADTLFVPCSAPSEAAQFLTHLAAAGTWARRGKRRFSKEKGVEEVWVLGTPEWYSNTLLRQAKRYVEGVMFPAPYAAETARGAAFAKIFTQHTGRAPTHFDALLSDAIDALLQASGEGPDAAEALQKMSYTTGASAGLHFKTSEALPGLFMIKVAKGHFSPMP